MRGSARLRGVRRVAANAGLSHCQRRRFRVNSWWYSTPFDDLASLLRSMALLHQLGKHRAQWWRHWAGHTSFGLSAGSWVRLNLRYGMRLGTPAKCSMSCEIRVEKQLLHPYLHLCGGGSGRNGSQSVPKVRFRKALRGQPSCCSLKLWLCMQVRACTQNERF